MTKTQNKLFIGTSGWVYKSWHKEFYPKEMKKDFLGYYSEHFNSVEINTTFYHLPTKNTFKKWRNETVENFICAVKMSRYITHIKKLKQVKMSTNRFLNRAKMLDHKLGPILVQLPPSLKFDQKLIEKFITDLHELKLRNNLNTFFSLEPRNKTFFEESNTKLIRSILKENGMGLVLAHSSVFPQYDPDNNKNAFSDKIYIRFHGPKEYTASQYGSRRLKPWSERIRRWLDQGKTVYSFFNDDAHGYAIKDAISLNNLIERCYKNTH